MKSTLLFVCALVLLSLVGCAQYNDIAISGDKAYLSYNQFPFLKGVTVCTIGSDGMLTNCKDAQ